MTTELDAGAGGVFDVFVDGKLIFSKHEVGDFPEPEDIVRRIKALQKPPAART